MGNIYSQHQLLYGTRTNCTTAARRGALRSSDSSVRILRLSEQKPGSRVMSRCLGWVLSMTGTMGGKRVGRYVGAAPAGFWAGIGAEKG